MPPMPPGIDDLAAGDNSKPPLGVRGNSVRRPLGERRRERVGQRILGGGNIAGARSEESDELAVAAADHRLGGIASIAALPAHRATSAKSGAPRPSRKPRPGSATPRTAQHRDRAPRS